MRVVRIVYFDAGGTLIAPHPSVGEVYARAGGPHGITAAPSELERAFRVAWKAQPESPIDRASWRRIVERVLNEVAFRGDRAACFEAMYLAFAETRAWRIYEDVIPTLRALANEGLRLGVLSNWDERLRPLLRALELEAWFDPIVISSEVGLAKPDPRVFALAAERAGVPPEEIAYVGDHIQLDLLPSRQLGMRGYLIDRTGKVTHEHALRSLLDLLSVI